MTMTRTVTASQIASFRQTFRDNDLPDCFEYVLESDSRDWTVRLGRFSTSYNNVEMTGCIPAGKISYYEVPQNVLAAMAEFVATTPRPGSPLFHSR